MLYVMVFRRVGTPSIGRSRTRTKGLPEGRASLACTTTKRAIVSEIWPDETSSDPFPVNRGYPEAIAGCKIQ